MVSMSKSMPTLILGLLLVIGLGVTALLYRGHLEAAEAIRTDTRAAVAETAELIADRIPSAVLLGNHRSLREDLDLVQSTPAIQRLEVFRLDGAGLLAGTRTEDSFEYSEAFQGVIQQDAQGFEDTANKQRFSYVKSLEMGGRTIGWLRLVADANRPRPVIRESFQRFVVESAALWLLIGLIVSAGSSNLRMQNRLERRLRTDELTGELSRYGFKADYADGRREQAYGLFLLDIHNFKAINESHGSDIGDQILAAIPSAIRRRVTNATDIARLDGDDFAVVAPASNWDEARATGGALLQAIGGLHKEQPSVMAPVRGAIGGVLLGRTDELSRRLSEADRALERARESSSSEVVLADANFLSESQQRGDFITEKEIRKGLEKGQFRYYIQPIVDVQRNLTVGYEALIRWQADGELRSPAVFLDKFKEVTQDPDMYKHVVSLRQQLSARAAKNGVPMLCYNIRLEDIGRLHSAERLKVDSGGNVADGLHVVMEISESGIPRYLGSDISWLGEAWKRISSPETMLALDDFGALESNLFRLLELDIDYLKVDKAMITAIDHDLRSRAILRAVASLCKELDIKVIAEGVEQQAQAEALSELGVSLQQGFYHGYPQPVEKYLV